jgi:hypothetical protein
MTTLSSHGLTVRTAVVFLGAVSLTLSSCGGGKRIPAVGPSHEIVILSAPGSRALAEKVSQILGAEILLVHYEPRFVTVTADLAELSFYETRKILFVVGNTEEEAFRSLLRRATGERERTAFPGLWLEREPFSAGQILFLLSGEGSAVEQSLSDGESELVAIVEEAVVELLRRNIFRAGEIAGARDRMLRTWGWGVRVPQEWEVDDRFAQEGFVRVWRDAPVAQLFVSWGPGDVKRTPAQWLDRRDELTLAFCEKDRIHRARSEASEGGTPFGLDGVRLTGLWENAKYDIGGPFESWSFYCSRDGRTYFVDLSVYAPDRDKEPLLRMLRALVGTFRCACVSAAARAGNAD